MAVKLAHYSLNLSGAAQPLSDAFPAVTGTLKAGAYDYPCIFLSLQPDGANANPIFVGSDNTITSALYGVRLEAGSAGVPPAPYIVEVPPGNIKAGDVWVLGTAGQDLHILLLSL